MEGNITSTQGSPSSICPGCEPRVGAVADNRDAICFVV